MRECKTFCPEDGWDVKVDEDGLCVHCGATAMGSAIDALYEELESLRKKDKKYEVPDEKQEAFPMKRVDVRTYGKVLGEIPILPGAKISEICKKMHLQACHMCDDFSCKDNQNKEK